MNHKIYVSRLPQPEGDMFSNLRVSSELPVNVTSIQNLVKPEFWLCINSWDIEYMYVELHDKFRHILEYLILMKDKTDIYINIDGCEIDSKLVAELSKVYPQLRSSMTLNLMKGNKDAIRANLHNLWQQRSDA